MATKSGRVPSGQALAVPVEPVSRLDPSGFDPSRVRVTAADFNGYDWDGSPFNHVPKWLEAALRSGAILIAADDRDYALWAVQTPTGEKIAEPGDDIVCLDGHLDVHKDSYLAALAAGTRSAETPSAAQSEGCQSGAAETAQRPTSSTQSGVR